MARYSTKAHKSVNPLAATAVGIAILFANIGHAANSADVDNTRINDRDTNERQLTPLDQSNTSGDTAIVAKIRSTITDDKSLSVNAQNVKIIVRSGVVTLRGPVDNAAEKSRIAAIAKNVAGVASVQNEIDIKN